MALEIVFAVLLLALVALTLVPTLPGIPMMFFLTLIYGVFDHFQTLRPEYLLWFGAIAVVSVVIDYSSGILGAKFGGASKKAILAGFLGLLIGMILLPPFGAFLGLFSGIFVVEVIQFNDHRRAFKAASSSLAASFVGVFANACLAVLYWVLFLVIVF